MKYILFGNVRDKTLREVSEYHIEKELGGEILFYVDDNSRDVSEIKDRNGVYSPEVIKDYPDAVVVVLCSDVVGATKKLVERGIRNVIKAAPILGYRFIIDDYCEPIKMIEKVCEWKKENEEFLKKLIV